MTRGKGATTTGGAAAMLRVLGLTGVVAIAMGVAGCAPTPQSMAAAGETGRLALVSPQPAGPEIWVAEIGMPSPGWVVVHAVKAGSADLAGAIGHVYVPAGPSSDVVVPLDVIPAPGSEAVVMLHLDTGNPRVFEYGAGGVQPQDLPVQTEDGSADGFVQGRVTLN